ncbi:hypothetical protein [Desulfobacter postgatei]|jgi:hypothetical protein|uniref:hypothetical protein n=1 Tax=Desulfobacter postgatei TaxID=2293 RepID=UPI002A3635AD|nr:hypothetical protein [Desulfobacter postgatei]MDX9965260.1 hypothetical protein [Desulfobacter postgatei]
MKFPVSNEPIELSQYLENAPEEDEFAYRIRVQTLGHPARVLSEAILGRFSEVQIERIFMKEFINAKLGIVQDDNAAAWIYTPDGVTDIVSNAPSFAWEVFNLYFSSNKRRFEAIAHEIKISNSWTYDPFLIELLRSAIKNHMSEKQEGRYSDYFSMPITDPLVELVEVTDNGSQRIWSLMKVED